MKLKLSELWAIKHLIIGWLVPIIYLPILLVSSSQESKCAYVVLIMVTFWFTEVVPMSVTALLPVFMFPLLQVVSSDDIAKAYFNGTIMVFLGSLIAATAVEKSNLHERIALKVILLNGTSPNRLLMGFMFTTAFLSMWISNLAAVALMVPIVNAALDQLSRRKSISYGTCSTDLGELATVYVTVDDKNKRKNSLHRKNSMQSSSVGLNKKATRRLRKGILLGICYAANIGGTGTLTGTSTNLILNGFLKNNAISFSDWLFFNLPGLIILIVLSWVFLSVFFVKNRKNKLSNKQNEERVYELIRIRYDQLGSLTFHETSVLILFGMLLVLWFFRSPDFMPGWTNVFSDRQNYIKDSAPAIFVVVLFFLIPADPSHLKSSPMLLDWKTTQDRVSWGVMLLLGGGFAMAKGFEDSGLSQLIGDWLGIMQGLPHSLITIIMCMITATLTEFTSNAATCTILLPVIYRMTLSMGMNPLSIMLPVTVCSSYAFMLPVASGTNAIIFEVGKMKTKDMFIPGFFVKIICVAVLVTMTSLWGNVIFNLHSPWSNTTRFG